ncbi:MAG: TetR/AcrR family transcriptional regulator [Marmoricola sp.]
MATGGASAEAVTSHLRLGLNPRQTETVERLLLAGEQELEEVGPEALTIRMVAQRAGVSPATAYTYLASKNHLFAELFWRAIAAEPTPEQVGGTAVDRVRGVTRHFSALLGRSPHLATAANIALLGTDPEVERLRLVIGSEFVNRFRDAIGEGADARVVDAITLAFAGALLQAGMGLMTYDELSQRLDDVVAVIMEGH